MLTRAEGLAKAGHAHLQRVRARLGAAPQLLGQPLRGHHLVRVHEQEGEKRTLAAPAQLDPSIGIYHLERPQNPEGQRHRATTRAAAHRSSASAARAFAAETTLPLCS